MISGAHVLIYSTNSDADAAFMRDVLALPHVDAGEGFLIFGLPPAEMAMHETKDGNSGKSELHLVVDSIDKFVAAMQERSIACDPIADQGWGVVSRVTLPSGIKLGVYEPRHARPEASGHASGAVKAAAKAAKQAKKAAKALRATAKAVKKATKKATKAAKKAKKHK